MADAESAQDISNLEETLDEIDTSGNPPPADEAITENGETVNLNEDPDDIVTK